MHHGDGVVDKPKRIANAGHGIGALDRGSVRTRRVHSISDMVAQVATNRHDRRRRCGGGAPIADRASRFGPRPESPTSCMQATKQQRAAQDSQAWCAG